MTDKYKAIKKVFKEGDWVIGLGDHEGCSQVFDHDTNNPQPFSYLSEADPSKFRLANNEEIAAACIKFSHKEVHSSDCATSNSPGMTPSYCDC